MRKLFIVIALCLFAFGFAKHFKKDLKTFKADREQIDEPIKKAAKLKR
jgi:hypothetical protein